MFDGWWWSFGLPSSAAGLGLGLMWAVFNTRRRRRKFARAGLEPAGQRLWFLINLVSMSGYLTLLGTVSLLAYHEHIPPEAAWLLIGSAGASFCAALLFNRFDTPFQIEDRPMPERPANRPLPATSEPEPRELAHSAS